jgi:hypothetical protein
MLPQELLIAEEALKIDFVGDGVYPKSLLDFVGVIA